MASPQAFALRKPSGRRGERSAIYTGTLVHARRAPKDHVFRNRMCFYLLDLDELSELDSQRSLFSYNKPNLVTLRDGDHLGDPDTSIKENVATFLARHDVALPGGRTLLLTNLRVCGYTFNPVSFFYCYSAADELACVIAEVHNTFGERWPYLLRTASATERHAVLSETEKKLHVSPFFGLDQRYTFALSEPRNKVYARIDVAESGTRMFGAVLAGTRHALTSASLIETQLRYPLMPARVSLAIHWHALRLRLKGIPFHAKPEPPPGVESARRALPGRRRSRRPESRA